MADVTIGGTLYRVRQVAGTSGSLGGRDRRHALQFDAWRPGSRDPDVLALMQAVIQVAPATFDGIAALDMAWRENDETPGHYTFTLNYSPRAVESLLRWSFDSTGGTVRMTTSRATQAYAAPGRTAPDYKGAIGVRNGEPEGVDVVIPALKLTANYKWPANSIGISYVKTIAGLAGGTNNGSFYTFAAGELLYLGSTGEVVPGVPTDVAYHFVASANVTGLSIGEIAGVAKAGHDFLWVLFEPAADTPADKLVQRPLAAYVERVYAEVNFATLGIGTA
jgi:hypothetical protein